MRAQTKHSSFNAIGRAQLADQRKSRRVRQGRRLDQQALSFVAAAAPAEARDNRGQARLIQDGEHVLARPQHQRRPPVGAFEGGSFVAGRLVEMFLVGIHLREGIRRTDFFILERKLAQRRGCAVRLPPLGQAHAAVANLAGLEFFLIRSPAASRMEVGCIFGNSALLDRKLRQMQVAATPRYPLTTTRRTLRHKDRRHEERHSIAVAPLQVLFLTRLAAEETPTLSVTQRNFCRRS